MERSTEWGKNYWGSLNLLPRQSPSQTPSQVLWRNGVQMLIMDLIFFDLLSKTHLYKIIHFLVEGTQLESERIKQ